MTGSSRKSPSTACAGSTRPCPQTRRPPSTPHSHGRCRLRSRCDLSSSAPWRTTTATVGSRSSSRRRSCRSSNISATSTTWRWRLTPPCNPMSGRPTSPLSPDSQPQRCSLLAEPTLRDRFKGGLDAPICLTWELTYACNLACIHCLSSSGRRDPRELTTAEAKAVIDEMVAMQVVPAGPCPPGSPHRPPHSPAKS